MAQVLVSVRFQGYYLELLISKDTAIRDLVSAMRDNTFIPADIPIDRLKFSKSQGYQVQLDDLVQSIIEDEQNSVHYLMVDVLPQYIPPPPQPPISRQPSCISTDQSQSQQKRGPQYIQAQTNRILQRIVRYLKEGNIQSLLRARQNKRIQSTMSQYLALIGQSFHKLQQQCKFFQNVIQKINISQSASQLQNYVRGQKDTYGDFVVDKTMNLIDDVCNLKRKYFLQKQRLSSNQSQIHIQGNRLSQLQQEIENNLQTIRNLQISKKSQQALIRTYEDEINELKLQLEQNNDQIQVLKTSQNSLKDLISQKQTLIQTIQTQLNSCKLEMVQKTAKVIQLEQKIGQNHFLISNLQKQNKNVKQSSIDILSNRLIKDYLDMENQNDDQDQPKVAIKGNINDIIRNQAFSKQLLSPIQQCIGGNIKQVFELMSYNCADHRNYSLKNKFTQYLSNKQSLLFIARTKGNKFFGAFTTEKLSFKPQSYYLPDFNGISFLFSVINDKLQIFQLKQGQNSLLFDFQYLIFGNQDLILNFQEYKCTSKFVLDKYSYYQIDLQKPLNYHHFFLTDQDQKSQQSQVKVSQYKIYQLRLN